MKRLLVIILLILSGISMAGIRCQGSLVNIGDSQYALIKACGEPVSTHVVNNGGNGGYGNEIYFYYKIDGRVIEVHLIDGHIYEINGDSLH